MKRRINYINRGGDMRNLTFWYLFYRRNRMYSHNIFLVRRFKLCLNPLKSLYLRCCRELLMRTKISFLYWKITNIKERFEMYKMWAKSSHTKLFYENNYNTNNMEFSLFLLSLYELYVLCVILLNKNNCF